MAPKHMVASAATEHGGGGLNLVFVNIDWKIGRHANQTASNKNARVLAGTVASIVANMDPAAICFCEFGGVRAPLKPIHVELLKQTIERAWKENAATEHVRFIYEAGEPYLTAFRSDQLDCRHSRTVRKLYYIFGEPRTAQFFLATQPGQPDAAGINIVNVHAPSGNKRLTNAQRITLMRKLLGSTSLRTNQSTLGHDAFIIGGDMNSSEIVLTQMVETCEKEEILSKGSHAIKPSDAKHGDILLQLNVPGDGLRTQARNHDPQHVPYGFCWRPTAASSVSAQHAPALSASAQQKQSLYTDVASVAPSSSSDVTCPLGAPASAVQSQASSATEQRKPPAYADTVLRAAAPCRAHAELSAASVDICVTAQPAPAPSGTEQLKLPAYADTALRAAAPMYVLPFSERQRQEGHAELSAASVDSLVAAEPAPATSATEQRSPLAYADTVRLAAAPQNTLPLSEFLCQEAHTELSAASVGSSATAQPAPPPCATEQRKPLTHTEITSTAMGSAFAPPGRQHVDAPEHLEGTESRLVAAEPAPATSATEQRSPLAYADTVRLAAAPQNTLPLSEFLCQEAHTELSAASVGSSATAQPAPPPCATEQRKPLTHTEITSTAMGSAFAPPGRQHVDAPEHLEGTESHAEQQKREQSDFPLAIINAFLGYPAQYSDASEDAIQEVVNDEAAWSTATLNIIAEVFEPIFFHFPRGLKDRSVWQARSPDEYITQWREHAKFRLEVIAGAVDGLQFTRDQRQQAFQYYLHWFAENEARPGQKNLKSAAEARLNKLCGSRHVMQAIWEIGLPKILGRATEQPDVDPTPERLLEIKDDATKILQWLDDLAYAIENYRRTKEYCNQVAKSGSKRGESGLSAQEELERQEFRQAKTNLREGARLGRLWAEKRIKCDELKPQQWKLLEDHWNGALQQHYENAVSARGLQGHQVPELF